MIDEEATFRSNVTRSRHAALVVADYLVRLGYEASVPETRIRPAFEDRSAYGDGGNDVVLCRRESFLVQKVEVKWRGLDFTGADDYPFATVNVDRVAKVEACGPALLYVSANRLLTHGCFILGSTQPHWLVEESTDDARGYSPFRIYRCPIGLCYFEALTSR
jgi:hypothetical protein